MAESKMLARAITTREPRALIWAPTPPAQAPKGNQPWDFAVEGSPAKLLVIENKSLINTSMKGAAHHVPTLPTYRPRPRERPTQPILRGAIGN